MAFVVWFLRLVAMDVQYDEDPATGEQVEKSSYHGPDLVLISDILRLEEGRAQDAPNQQRTLNKLPTELRRRNFVNKHRPSMQIGANHARTCMHCVIYFELSFRFA